MGGGNWTTNVYTARSASKAAAGKSTFDYTDQVRAGRASTVNELVDPRLTAGPASPHAGKVMREVMITDEHPNPTAIAVLLDVTGSNIDAAFAAHAKLPQLHGLLQRKGYAEDPQILFGAIGDANTDRFPLQVGQFESDNRMDEQLEAIILEGNGGGQSHETYELGAYFLARHTYLEPFERFGKKGYVFFIGDEMPYSTIRTAQVKHLIGDTLDADIATEQIFRELQKRYEVFFLFQTKGSYDQQQILPAWRKLLGERALVLDDPAAVCEVIVATLGMLEAGYDHDEVMGDLVAIGADITSVRAAGKALARMSDGNGLAARSTGTLPDTHRGGSGTTRL